MNHAFKPLFSLLEQGREADAAEYVVSYLGAANRRGRESIELPLDRRTAPLKDRLEGLGFDVRSMTVEGKTRLEVRMVSRESRRMSHPSSLESVRHRREP